MATLEKLTGFLFVVSCALLIAMAFFTHSSSQLPTLRPQLSFFTHSLQISLVPITLVTLLALSFLLYFYKSKCDQAELALRNLNTALENSNELIDRMANSDLLTDTLNSRGLEKLLTLDVARAMRAGMPLIALVIDLDDGKQIVDRLGLDGADIVLKEVAERLKKAARRHDRLARVGNYKFIVLVHDVSPNDAMLIADRMTAAIAKPAFMVKGKDITVSVSIGMSALSAEVTSIEQILALTEASLLKCKALRQNLA